MPKDNEPINSLPEYEIRTMEDDINKLEGRPIQSSHLTKPLIQNIPKAPSSPTPLPSMPLPTKPLPPPVKPLSPPIDISPPETLPIIIEKPVVIEEPKVVIEEPKIKKAPLPSMEEFIAEAPRAPKPELPKPEIPKLEIKPEELFIPKIQKREKRLISPEARKQRTKRILIILIIVLAIIALGLFFYWRGTKPEPLPPQLPDNEIKIPDPLIPVDETKILKIGNNISLENLLRDESMINQQSRTIKRIVPVKNEKEILLLNELLKELKIAVYPYVLSELNDNYNLIIYGQDTNRTIGLIIQSNNPNNVKEQLKYWEATMADDLKNLFLFKKPGNPTTKFFKDNTYNNIVIRYINFPDPDLTIDYAVSGNLFILSTSRESIYNIIDRISP